MNTARRVGRYTKHETTELLRMFEEGYSVYKICRNLNRSQNSIRNNLIRLGKIDGEITPRRYTKIEKYPIIETYSIFDRLLYLLIISFISFIMIINPYLNPLEIIMDYFYMIFEYLD